MGWHDIDSEESTARALVEMGNSYPEWVGVYWEDPSNRNHWDFIEWAEHRFLHRLVFIVPNHNSFFDLTVNHREARDLIDMWERFGGGQHIFSVDF